MTNKFASSQGLGDSAIADKLFVKTKQLLTTVLPCTTADNLIGCLKSVTTPHQANYYWDLIEKREAGNKHAERNATMLEHTNLFKDDEGHLPLDETKRLILKNLQILERHGLVSSKVLKQCGERSPLPTSCGANAPSMKSLHCSRVKSL